MSKRCVFLCLCIFLSWGAGAPLDAAEGQGRLRGILFEKASGRPLAGLWVKVAGMAPQRTDRDGAFSFFLRAGQYRVRIWGDAFSQRISPKIPVVSGEVTEALLTIPPKGAGAEALVEAAIRRYALRQVSKARGPLLLVRGRVLSQRDKKPVASAQIFVKGQAVEAQADPQGRFQLRLPKGYYELTVIHPSYSTARKKLKIPNPKMTSLIFAMAPASIQLQAFTVTAPRIVGSTDELMKQRKQAGGVSEMIGAEQMAKSGDANAASALRRVSGVTIVGGRFVYVRGLGDRYSSTLFNGATLPSPEPEKRVVPLDLFPSGILERMVLEKTYLPYLPAEFGGGSVQLYTRSFPKKFQSTLSLQLGYIHGATFTQASHYQGGWSDFLTFGLPSRGLHPDIRKASEKTLLLPESRLNPGVGYPREELERLGELLPNVWNTQKMLVPPQIKLSFTLGDSFSLPGQVRTGYFLYVNYDNNWQSRAHEEGGFERQNLLRLYFLGQGKKLELNNDYKFQQLENGINLGGMFVWGLEIGDAHKIRVTSLINRIVSNETRIVEGYNANVLSDIRLTRFRWIERTLSSTQLRGEHILSKATGLRLNWRYTYSLALRAEPDRRETRYDQSTDGHFQLSDLPEGNLRFFSDLTDHNHDLAVDLTLPFKQWSGLKAEARMGGLFAHKSRVVDTRRYKFQMRGDPTIYRSPEMISQEPESIFTPENIGANGYQFEEITRQTDNYRAHQWIGAVYAMVRLPLTSKLRLEGGARFEYSLQEVETFELFRPSKTPVMAKLDTPDILPALSLSWDVADKMVLRAAGAMTVSRPDFRELSPATFDAVAGGRQLFGNPNLERALISHADLRWEWYPDSGEAFSVGAFYKYFYRPIETKLIVSANQSITFANADGGAHNVGAELDFRKRLGFLHKYLRDFYVAGNLTLVWSQIQLPADSIETNKIRPLQGQSPYVINFTLGYDNADTGTSVALLYNVFGPRIAEVGADGIPDTYEEPFHQLDLVVRQRFAKRWLLTLKAQNLINLPKVFTLGDQTTRLFYRNRSFSVSLAYRFQ
ncbi:MAG: TonB-dependent receptor [Myxococcales bacterium]|nr:TonB-dependent receptor [Myxococcales bacterium]MCB9644037.1 TonB-dependent receptor [Myxococcales bacterium]